MSDINNINGKNLFIFDLDGTLVDAYEAIEKSLNFTREKFGYKPVSYDVVKRNVGKGDILFIRTFFPGEQAEAALEIYRKHHKTSLKKYVWLKPYARWLLHNLKRKKTLIAIASNRPAYYTDIIIKTVGIRKYLDYVLCADQIEALKPDPRILLKILKKFGVDTKSAVYVGDMDIDLETAKRAKMDAIFVPGGSSRLKDVKKYKNKKIVHSLKEIKNLSGDR